MPSGTHIVSRKAHLLSKISHYRWNARIDCLTHIFFTYQGGCGWRGYGNVDKLAHELAHELEKLALELALELAHELAKYRGGGGGGGGGGA